MSIYNKSVSKINITDIEELIKDKAIENVRLEFKKDPPQNHNDNMTKKISSFANTFGGYIILGAEDDENGKLISLPGTDIIPNYKQTIIQLCQTKIFPPICPQVSPPIKKGEKSKRVFYVIYIEASEEAPHFINNRKGVYYRTDELSKKVYQAEFANQKELELLFNRREKLISFRKNLFQRAEKRGYAHINIRNPQPILSFSIVPQYPFNKIIESYELYEKVKESQIGWQEQGFPYISTYNDNVVSQHESLILYKPDFSDSSLLEINSWGMIHWMKVYDYRDTPSLGYYIPIRFLAGDILAFFKYASNLYEKYGLKNSLYSVIRLNKVKNTIFTDYDFRANGREKKVAVSELDNTIEVVRIIQVEELIKNNDEVVKNILKEILYSVNLRKNLKDESIVDNYINAGYEYNKWKSN